MPPEEASGAVPVRVGSGVAERADVKTKHGSSEGERLNREFQLELEERHRHISEALDNADRGVGEDKRIVLRFDDIRVSMTGNQILKGISGEARPGQLLSIMGPSGSGKTTLLNSIAGRQKLAGGKITLNGQSQLKAMKRHVAYVLQDEVFFGSLTVRQVMYFTAQIRLPDAEMTPKQKIARADQIMRLLGIDKCADSIVGTPFQRGISGGERRRLSVGVQLITWPTLILLDEPTSGLDSSTAYDLILTTRELAKRGCTVVCTVHQPSSAIFQLFDKLLVVANGETFYYGNAQNAVGHIESRIGYKCPSTYNPGDFVLELAKSNSALSKVLSLPLSERTDAVSSSSSLVDKRTSASAVADRQASSFGMPPVAAEALRASSLTEVKLTVLTTEFDANTANPTTTEVSKSMEEGQLSLQKQNGLELSDGGGSAGSWENSFPTSWWTQYKALYGRAVALKRTSTFDVYQIGQISFVAVILSLIYFQMSDNEDAIQDRFALVFFITIFWTFFPMFNAVTTFPAERAVLLRERAQGSYRLSAYYFAKMAAEMPFNWLSPSLFIILVYWMTGINNNVGTFFTFWALLILNVELAVSMGMLISAAETNPKKALTVVSILVLGSMLLGGFYVDPDNIPDWLSWIQWLSFVRYSFGSMATTAFNGAEFKCSSDNSEFASCEAENDVISGSDVLDNRNIDNLQMVYSLVIFFGVLATKVATYYTLFYRYKPKTPTK